jgi:hypothetical protein
LGSFYNLESTANSVTKTILDDYNCITSKANTTTITRPKVAIVQYLAPSDFNNQTASWEISADKFEIDYVTGAGGDFYSSNVTNAVPRPVTFSNAADFLKAIEPVDILIDASFASTVIADVYKAFGLSDAATNYKFVAKKQVWMANRQINANAGSAYFEAAVVLGNTVLADLTAIIHPELLPPSKYTPTFFRNLYASPMQVTLTAADCKDAAGALAVPTTCPASFTSGSFSWARCGASTAVAAGAAAAAVALLA